MKKILGFVVIFAMLYAFAPYAFADTTIGGIRYGNWGGVFAVAEECDKSATDVTVLSEVEGLPVRSILSHAFENCTHLKSVKITDGVEQISDNAFKGCTTLNDIIIPDSVTSIWQNAFEQCTSLVRIDIPENASIHDSVFKDCTSLVAVSTPRLSSYMFQGCTSLENVTVLNKSQSIGSYVFDGCTSLKSITIPESIRNIDDAAFDGCTNLESINVNSENKYFNSVDGVLFEKETSLLRYPTGKKDAIYTVPNGTYSINMESCCNNKYIESLIIPDSIGFIGEDAFAGCDKLSEIRIAEGAEGISSNAFDDTQYYNDISNWNDGVLYIGHYLIKATNVPSVYTIKLGTSSIASGAFFKSHITTVHIPTSVTYIGGGAFEMSTLTDIYYDGTKEQWEIINVVFTDGNYGILNATIHYNNTDEPLPEPCFTVTGQTVTNTADAEQKAAVIVADYTNGVLTDISAQDVTFAAGQSKQFSYGNGAEHKIFVWDSLSGMKPLCESE